MHDGKEEWTGAKDLAISRHPSTCTHLEEVRVSELNNPLGHRQPAVQEEPPPRREWLTYAEAGEMVGLSRVTLWKLANAKAIKVRHVGRAVRISRASLDAFMNSDEAADG